MMKVQTVVYNLSNNSDHNQQGLLITKADNSKLLLDSKGEIVTLNNSQYIHLFSNRNIKNSDMLCAVLFKEVSSVEEFPVLTKRYE